MKNFLKNNWFRFVIIILWITTLSIGLRISKQMLDGPQKPDTKDCKPYERRGGNEDGVEWQCQHFTSDDDMGYNEWIRVYPQIETDSE